MNNKPNLCNIVLIGGGIMRKNETAHIDKWLIESVKKYKEIPHVLFIPAASNDLPDYVKDFTNRYHKLGATVSSLELATKKYSALEIKNNFKKAQLIYVGGGNVDLLLETVVKYNLEQLFIDFTYRGILSGLSAGALIWFTRFINFDRTENGFENIRAGRGLGWINSSICTHFSINMLDNPEVAPNKNYKALIAIGDKVAVTWKGRSMFSFKSTSDDIALIYKYNAKTLLIVKEEIPELN